MVLSWAFSPHFSSEADLFGLLVETVDLSKCEQAQGLWMIQFLEAALLAVENLTVYFCLRNLTKGETLQS